MGNNRFTKVTARTLTVSNNTTLGGDIELNGAVYGATVSPSIFVDTVSGSDSNTGGSWSSPFQTMAAAIAAVATGGKILFRGDVREEIVGSNLKFDVTIEGVGSLHHADLPAAGYHTGAAIWRAPATETGTTPLLQVRGRGWTFKNFMVQAPTDAAAFKLVRNALSGTSEYDASHATFENVRCVGGLHFIEDVGGCYNVTVENCQIAACTGAAIYNSSTAVANPLNWKILDNIFPSDVSDFGNVTHIDSPLNCAVILGNVFGKVRSTAKYIDLTGSGGGNVICDNVLGGAYDTGDYVFIAGDLAYNNRVAVKATTAPDGLTLTVPSA